MNLVCFNIQIRRDKEGRYCLNDLHKAAIISGANGRTKEPGKFLASPQIIELVGEIETTQNFGIAPVNKVKGGLQQGTYVCKELVYSYAMWISSKFHLHVIQTFDQFAISEQVRIAERQAEAGLEVGIRWNSAISLTTQSSPTTIPEYFFAMMIENLR